MFCPIFLQMIVEQIDRVRRVRPAIGIEPHENLFCHVIHDITRDRRDCAAHGFWWLLPSSKAESAPGSDRPCPP